MPGSGYVKIKDKRKEEAWIILLVFVLCMIAIFAYLVSCRYKRIIENFNPEYENRNEEDNDIPPPYIHDTIISNNSIDNNICPPPYNSNYNSNYNEEEYEYENESRIIIEL